MSDIHSLLRQQRITDLHHNFLEAGRRFPHLYFIVRTANLTRESKSIDYEDLVDRDRLRRNLDGCLDDVLPDDWEIPEDVLCGRFDYEIARRCFASLTKQPAYMQFIGSLNKLAISELEQLARRAASLFEFSCEDPDEQVRRDWMDFVYRTLSLTLSTNGDFFLIRPSGSVFDMSAAAIETLVQEPKVPPPMPQGSRFPRLDYSVFNHPDLSEQQVIRMAGLEIRKHRRHFDGTPRPGGRLDGKTFDERFPGVSEWLAERVISHDEAVRRHEEWEQAEVEEFKKLNGGITCNPEDAEILVVKTSPPGVSPPMHRTVRTSNYTVVPGQSADVCPQAEPKIAEPLAEEIATRLREIGALNPGETIHWTGSATGIENVCRCELPKAEQEAPTSPPSQVGNNRTRRRQLPPPHLKPGYLELIVDEDNQKIWSKDRRDMPPVELGGFPAQWYLFLVMWKAGEDGVSRGTVERGYPADMEWSAKRVQMNDLRRRLSSLTVTADNVVRGIHRLIKKEREP